MGLFDPKAGSRTHPDKSQGIVGDVTYYRTMCDIWEPDERNLSKYDPDAIKYHTGETDQRHTARGHRDMFIGTRNKQQNERIILSLGGVPASTPEGGYFVDKLREITENHNEMRKGLMHAIYDMAIYAKNHDDLLDLGITPISKVARATGRPGGKPASMTLGPHTFNLRNGEPRDISVVAIDGSACIAGTDADGEIWYKPLKLRKVEEQPSGGRTLVYLHFEIPDYALFPPALIGAATRVRLNSTKAEIEALPKHRRRTRVLRAFAEGTTEQYEKLFGRREDAEAAFSHLKGKTRGRVRSIGGKKAPARPDHVPNAQQHEGARGLLQAHRARRVCMVGRVFTHHPQDPTTPTRHRLQKSGITPTRPGPGDTPGTGAPGFMCNSRKPEFARCSEH